MQLVSSASALSILLFVAPSLVMGMSDEHVAVDLHLTDSLSSVLKTLNIGNDRYTGNRLVHPRQSRIKRQQLVSGQHPIAAILSCADSRVPPELIFDQGLGDLFTVRIAGNIVDDAVLGSLEYAVEHLKVPVIIVLGHTGCGAIQAAIEGGASETHVASLLKAIRPAVEQALHEKGVLVDNAVRDNVELVVKHLEESNPVLANLVQAHKLQIRGAVYHLNTGAVEYLK